MDGEAPGILVTVEDKLCVVKLNRPKKKNAIRTREYRALIGALRKAASDPEVAVVAVTGEGDYFTAGNDFVDAMQNASFEPLDEDGSKQKKGDANKVNAFKDFITALIDFPKPLVAVLNGPAVGMGVTTLALFDVVYASDKATFHTPFISLGLVAEGCSSYTFPRIMGSGKAAEVLLFERKLTAQEAFERGLVTEVFPHNSLHQVWPRIRRYAKLPPNTLVNVKREIRGHHKDMLHKVNDVEMDYLQKASRSEEALTGIMNVFAKRSKL